MLVLLMMLSFLLFVVFCIDVLNGSGLLVVLVSVRYRLLLCVVENFMKLIVLLVSIMCWIGFVICILSGSFLMLMVVLYMLYGEMLLSIV